MRYAVTSQPAAATSTWKSSMICGRATAIIVELSGANVVARATAATVIISEAGPSTVRACSEVTARSDSREDTDNPRGSIYFEHLPVFNNRGGRACAHHRRHAKLPRRDRRVRKHPARIGNQPRDNAEQGHPG